MWYIERQILRHIVLAQVCSDAGKGIREISIRGCEKASDDGYRSKEFHIRKAIELIDTCPRCGINYFVTGTPDQNGYASVLVYFDISLPEGRYQVSFHNPLGRSQLTKWIGKGRATRWRRSINSRKSCKEIAEIYDL